MKCMKKAISIFLVAILIFPLGSFKTFAAQENTPKEEVIYVSLNTDGSVKEINVVNIFDLDADGEIIDYGNYEELRNMTTSDEITYVEDSVNINAGAGKLYYEGKLDRNVMPWKVSIHYYLDEKEYSADELAGMSGNLKITMNITKNEECIGNFFDGYALQASFTLDTKQCSNVIADGATIANVGSNKQLTYTILPGEGADIEIFAVVKDFEMEGISINGVKLNLDVEIDDAAIQEKVDEIVGAAYSLDSGSNELNGGSKDLYDATGLLKNKTGELSIAVGNLKNGSNELYQGLSAISQQNQSLLAGAWSTFEGLCKASETMLNTMLNANGLPSITLTPQTYSQVLEELIQQMNAVAVQDEMFYQTIEQISSIKEELDRYSLFYNGLVSYTSAVSDATNGAETINSNLSLLYENTGLLDSSVGTLVQVVGKLYDGTKELKEGTGEFVDRTANINTEVKEEVDSMISALSGSDVETESFVSDKNTNIKSVQFVMKTNAIKKEEAEEIVVEEEESLNLWEKFLSLFGWKK